MFSAKKPRRGVRFGSESAQSFRRGTSACNRKAALPSLPGQLKEIGPERALAGVAGLQPSVERLVGLKARIVLNGRRQRVGFHQMACGMTVALRLGPLERVLDHGSAQQRRRKRVSSFELTGGLAEDLVDVPV